MFHFTVPKTVVLIIIIISFIFLIWKYQDNVSSIDLISKSYFLRNVMGKTPYFNQLNSLDLTARHSSSISEYKKMLTANIITFSGEEVKLLNELVNKINLHLEQFSKIEAIPWKFLKVNPNIENGYPHTLEDVIILSDLFFRGDRNVEQQMMTLLHEKIHIFQRLYPTETHELILNILKFQVKKMDSSFETKIRHNPDINVITYGIGDFYILQLYNSDMPKSISDSRPVKVNEATLEVFPIVANDLYLPNDISQLEHPYEIMASYLPYVILHRMPNSLMSKDVIKWLLQYAT